MKVSGQVVIELTQDETERLDAALARGETFSLGAFKFPALDIRTTHEIPVRTIYDYVGGVLTIRRKA